jgi:hypothetical protein
MSFGGSLGGLSLPLAALVLTLGFFNAGTVQGAALTYAFTQPGWTDAAGDTGTLTGKFTGTPETNGTIQLADLTSFTSSFFETVSGVPNTFVFNTPVAFSFDTNSPGSLEFSAGSAAANIQICSGSADTQQICLGIPSNSGAGSPDVGYFFDLPDFGPSQTRLASVETLQPQPGTAPEPSSVALVAAAAGMFLVVWQIKRRRGVRCQVRTRESLSIP